jgi:hypothetical protein
MLTV